MNKSTLKTKMRRAGFRISRRYQRIAWRKHWQYCIGKNKNIRVRWSDGVVDIGESSQTFDRWANSTERTLSIADFVAEFC
jgi:hypothetical protein